MSSSSGFAEPITHFDVHFYYWANDAVSTASALEVWRETKVRFLASCASCVRVWRSRPRELTIVVVGGIPEPSHLRASQPACRSSPGGHVGGALGDGTGVWVRAAATRARACCLALTRHASSSSPFHREYLSWLALHRRGHSVLVHANTGAVVADHTVNTLWLGQPIPLNIGMLERLAH